MQIGMIGLGRMGANMVRRYEFNLRDVAEVWRRGSVVASWLLDLTAAALAKDPGEGDFENRVLSAMRFAFGGHLEKPGSGDGGSR